MSRLSSLSLTAPTFFWPVRTGFADVTMSHHATPLYCHAALQSRHFRSDTLPLFDSSYWSKYKHNVLSVLRQSLNNNAQVWDITVLIVHDPTSLWFSLGVFFLCNCSDALCSSNSRTSWSKHSSSRIELYRLACLSISYITGQFHWT